MRKVILNMKESEKYEIIKKLVTGSGNKNSAAIKIGCTRRTINRLIRLYKKQGKEGFSHKNKGKPPAIMKKDSLKQEVINEYIHNYSDANLTHFCEILQKDKKITISAETLRLWLLEKNILSPKAHRKTKKLLKKKLKQELKTKSSKKAGNELKIKIEELDPKTVHPRRPRSKYLGEMIQMDASSYEWIKGQIWQLHLAIDDADNRVVGAYFDYEETLNGYYHVFYQILLHYGIPYSFYTDKRTVFEYRRKKRAFDDEDTFTQFAYACHKFGVQIKTTSVPQAKGRIERANQSFQSRLPIELRRANVTNIEEANEFLISYIEEYNKQFALQLNTTKSVYEPQPSLYDINNNLSVLSVRTIDHGNAIRFKKNIYLPVNQRGAALYLQEGMKVIMIETFDGRLLANVFDNLYQVKKLNEHELYSKNYDYGAVIENPIENTYLLPKRSPWRYDDFLGFLAKQKHRPEYRNQNCANI